MKGVTSKKNASSSPAASHLVFAEAEVCFASCAETFCCYTTAGSMHVNGEALGMRDAARIKPSDDSGSSGSGSLLKLEAASDGAHFLLIEMAKSDD